MSKLLILGAGGHGKVVAETALLMNQWSEIAFLDDKDNLETVVGISIVGKLNEYKKFIGKYNFAFVALGNNKLRIEWIEKLTQLGFQVPVIIHPFSSISPTVNLCKGTIIMAGVVINADTCIGIGCIINTSASIDHDCVVNIGAHISPGANIGGTVNIGAYTWVCIGSVVVNNIEIGREVIIAAGSTVTKSVPDSVMVAGVPASIKKKLGVIGNE